MKAGTYVDAALAAGVKFSTSRRTMRPPSPLPATLPISMPFSSAIFLANGDALRRPLVVAGAATGAATATAAGADTGAGATAGAAAAKGAGAAAAGMAAASDAIKAATSSPSLPRMAKMESTLAVWPLSTPMCRSTPSWKDSNSIVALSVSISASTSPLFTLSPTFLCHAATVPSVMVSLSLGMRTISAIVFSLAVYS